MILQRILLIYIALLHCDGATLRFEPSGGELLRTMVLDTRGHVFLGGVNVLYQLDGNLNPLNETVTGPVQDNPNCAPTQLEIPFCFDGGEPQMRTTDNYNQLLLVDERSGHLISCGNVFQGTCEARMLTDITFTIPESEAFLPDSHVVSTDQKLKSVAFVADAEEGKSSLYVGGYVSADGEFTPASGKKPGIANRQLVNMDNPENSFNFYRNENLGLYVERSWHPKPLVQVKYVAAFSDGAFAYFVFEETSRSGKETRLARTCLSDQGNRNSPLSDSTYTSYIEIALTCTHAGEKFPTLTAAQLAGESSAFYESGSAVLVGTFSNDRNTSAFCAFDFGEINTRLNNKVKACARGEGLKRIRSEALKDAQVKCSRSTVSCVDMCACAEATDNYPLEVEAPYSGVSALTVPGEVLALAANLVNNQIEVFAGFTQESIFSFRKVVFESPERAHLIDKYQSTLSSKPLQVEVVDGSKVLLLTQTSVSVEPISVCSAYVGVGCAECLSVEDPRCGWCEMTATCSLVGSCPTGPWRTAGSCTAITLITPSSASMANQHITSEVRISTNNPFPIRMVISCDFAGFGEQNATLSPDTGEITCQIPKLDPPVQGKHVVDVSLVSGDVVLAVAEQAFTFFNCESYTTCSSCTGSGVGCGWCNYANTCSETCHKTNAPEQCPALSYSMSYLPADFPHTLEIGGRNLPEPYGVDGASYQCAIDIGSEQTLLPAIYVNSSVLVCARNHTFSSPASSGQITAFVRVLWEGREVEPADKAPMIEIYRCGVLGRDCSTCRASSTVRRCGWCEESSSCLLQYGGHLSCPSSYSSVCRGLTIDAFEPKHGPVSGGTLVTIRGSNIGSRPSDITSIKIAGFNCEVQAEGFEVSRTVVCRTGPSGGAKHGLLEVTTSGDRYIYPQSMFYYKKYHIEGVSPSCALRGGGTELTIRGEQLNIGGKLSIIVGGTLCDVIGKPSSKQVKCITREAVVGSTRLQLRIDGATVESPDYVEIVENPSAPSLSSNKSISSGGIGVMVEFAEEFDIACVQQLQLVLEGVQREANIGNCVESGDHTFKCRTPPISMDIVEVAYMNAYLLVDDHVIDLPIFTIHPDPVIKLMNNTSPDGYVEWPIGGNRELVLNGQHLDKVEGIEVHVGGLKVPIKVTEDHIILTPPKYSALAEYRIAAKQGYRVERDTEEEEPDKRSHEIPSEYVAEVLIRLGEWEESAGRLYYTSTRGAGIPYVAIVIPVAGFLVLTLLLTYVGLKYRRSQQTHQRTLKEVRMHMEKVEMRVANECKDAFTALQTHLTDLQGDVADIPFRSFSDFLCNVLFPGNETETRDLVARLSAPPSKTVLTKQLSEFGSLLLEKEFLQQFVEVVEADPHFDVTYKCKMASLLVIAISSDMTYLTEVLFTLMERLIERFLAKKNHPQLLLRRTESVADKLLTHWLNYCSYKYLRNHAGKSIFTLYSAIKQQLDLGPQDEITFEAKSSLNNEKMLRETIEFKLLNGLVRDLNKTEHSVTLLTCDSIKQAKRKVIEAVHRNKPASQIPPIESFDLMYIQSGNTPIILREDKAPVVEGWRKLNTLSDYKIEDSCPVFAMIPLSSDSENSSLSPNTDRRKASFLTSKRYRSKGNLINSGLSSENEERHQVYHLIKPNHDTTETDTLLSTKMMSEVFLTRLLSTKGTLQPYVDDLFNTVFMTRERVPPAVKYLFDFLEGQAKRHNVAHNQAYIHTWKNNSLSLRFWMNVLKNPQFLLDINQTPTIDSSLNIVCGVFMDSCSTSDKGLTKDSPINKLLYAKDIPRYRKLVHLHYEQVSSLPKPQMSFLDGLPPTGLNSTVAVWELLEIARRYERQLSTSLAIVSPSLNLRFNGTLDSNLLTSHHMV